MKYSKREYPRSVGGVIHCFKVCTSMEGMFMKNLVFAIVIISYTVFLSGCGGGGGNDNNSLPPTYETQILSNPSYDGDIELATSVYTIAQGNILSVFAGIDPATSSETRAFLDFSLANVPNNAIIYSAKLDLFINSVNSLGRTIPIRIDLVSLVPPTLVGSDFDRNVQPALSSVTSDIFLSDVGHHVIIDITPLIDKAQILGLTYFQVRILEDFGLVSPGIFEIDDSTASKAPLISIRYQ
jgi:hypothetical protein